MKFGMGSPPNNSVGSSHSRVTRYHSDVSAVRFVIGFGSKESAARYSILRTAELYKLSLPPLTVIPFSEGS